MHCKGLFIISSRLYTFDDRSGIRMSVDYLVLLHDIHSVNTYAWGAGALLSCIDN